jgi:hypothetical protein
MDTEKIENGRPFFKKYIPIIKQIASAGWEPITNAVGNIDIIKIERFGEEKDLFFTVRNTGNADVQCIISIDLNELKIKKKFSAVELVSEKPIKVNNNNLHITIPAHRTQVVKIL